MGVKFSEECDISGKIVFPGLIDCHVHFREPGLEHKETMATGAAAALAGGVTTVCEMPNTVPPTVTIAALADKTRRAEVSRRIACGELCRTNSPAAHEGEPEFIPVDMRFFFGATESAHLCALRELWTGSSEELMQLKARCCGLKLYFDHSTGDQGADAGVLEEAFKLCGELWIVTVCHCEDAEMNQGLRNQMSDSRKTEDHSRMRPPESEEKAIQDALTLAKRHGARLHIAHLSTKGGLNLVRKAKADGIAVTCEVAPHHLFLTVENYKTLGALGKMNPPLRTRDHQEALWGGVHDGTIDCIATDHAPHTLKEKNCGDPLKAPSGVPGVETMLPLLLTAANEGKLHRSDVVRLCFSNPNRIFGLGKKEIIEGAPANLILVDPKKEWTIKAKELHSKCGWTPYEGWNVKGKIVRLIQL